MTPEVLAIEVGQHRFEFLFLAEVLLELAQHLGPDLERVVTSAATLYRVPRKRPLVAVLHGPSDVSFEAWGVEDERCQGLGGHKKQRKRIPHPYRWNKETLTSLTHSDVHI